MSEVKLERGVKMKDKALKYLNNNKLLYMDMIEPIRRNSADILYAGNDGVLIRERNSNAYMISMDNLFKGKELVNRLDSVDLAVAHDKLIADYIQNQFELKHRLECFQAVYPEDKCSYTIDTLNMKELGEEDIDIITKHYNVLSKSELSELLKRKNIFGGYKEGVLVGFIGTHLEGSIGLLNIFPEYRMMGYGKALESFMIDYILNKGYTPFVQIETNNKNSLLLQRKLGFKISSDRVYWMF